MSERNSCYDSGCRGYCCQDIDIEITKAERNRLFPGAEKVNSIEALKATRATKTQGVFYTEYSRQGLNDGEYYIIAINGPCPNRTIAGFCSKHEERESAARNFKIGCSDCNVIRKEHGVAPIFIELIE